MFKRVPWGISPTILERVSRNEKERVIPYSTTPRPHAMAHIPIYREPLLTYIPLPLLPALPFQGSFSFSHAMSLRSTVCVAPIHFGHWLEDYSFCQSIITFSCLPLLCHFSYNSLDPLSISVCFCLFIAPLRDTYH